MKSSKIVLVATVLFGLAGSLLGQSYPYVLTDLGTVPGQGAPLAWGIDELGDKTVGWFSWPTLGWVQDGTGMAPSGTLPGYAYSSARDVNDAGQIVGSSWITVVSQPGHAYRTTPGAGLVDLGTLGGTSSEARRINGDGSVVGDSLVAGDNSNMHAFLYTDAGGMVSLVPAASVSYGRGISHDGQVAGSMTVGNSWRAFRWTAGTGAVDLGVPAGYAHSYANAINDAGQVAGVVGLATGTTRFLYRWTPGSGFQVLGGYGSSANAWAINASGVVVGEGKLGSSIDRALYYSDALGLVDLNTLISPSTGWFLRAAHDVNDAGQIVGYGTLAATGETRAFRLDRVPAGSVAALGPGCGAGVAPALSATRPRLGMPLTFALQGIPSATGTLVVSNPPAAPTAIGPSCWAYIDLAAYAELAPVTTDSGGFWSTTFAVPNDGSLLGSNFALQAAIFPTAGPLGLDVSNGLLATIGY
jgi:probable HAF family extracellular repeat protein